MYRTPELLLVGAAENLVLGNSAKVFGLPTQPPCDLSRDIDSPDGIGFYIDPDGW
jgi:hypothetical protein